MQLVFVSGVRNVVHHKRLKPVEFPPELPLVRRTGPSRRKAPARIKGLLLQFLAGVDPYNCQAVGAPDNVVSRKMVSAWPVGPRLDPDTNARSQTNKKPLAPGAFVAALRYLTHLGDSTSLHRTMFGERSSSAVNRLGFSGELRV